MKISAIHQGGDWFDASAQYLVIPDGVDVLEEKKKHHDWCKEITFNPELELLDFEDWLLRIPGVRRPSEDELKVYDFR